MSDRSDWDKAANRPPCTAISNPFRELVSEDGSVCESDEPTLHGALADYYGEREDERARDRDPSEFGHVGLMTHPGKDFIGQVYTMLCDECGRLYFGVKNGFGCPHCGADRRGQYRKMYFTLWGAWGGK